MLLTTAAPRRHLFLKTSQLIQRSVSTLSNNPHIYIHPHPSQPKSHLLTLTPTSPPNPDLAIASSTTNPPEPDNTTENQHFLELLHSTIAEHAHQDPAVQAQAAAFASQGGAGLGSGGALFAGQQRKGTSAADKRNRRGVMDTVNTPKGGAKPTGVGGGGGAGGSGAGGASAQGGMGSGGSSGFIHVSDERNPPDWGRVAWPEDIFGSLEVDGTGAFVDGKGRYQRSGTYRMVTREGVLGLSKFLRERVVERMRELEDAMAGKR